MLIDDVYNIGSLVMEHPGTHPLPIQGKPTIFGGVNGSIGMLRKFDGELDLTVLWYTFKLPN